MLHPAVPREWLASLVGAALALFYASGRWSLERLERAFEHRGSDILAEPRVWIGAGLVSLLLVTSLLLRPLIRSAPRGSALVNTLTLLYLSYVASSYAWSPSPAVAEPKLHELLLLLAVCSSLLLANRIVLTSRVIAWFWGTFVAIAGLMALFALLQAGLGRLSVFGGGPNVFGRNMGLLFLGCLYFWRRTGQLWLWSPLATLALVLVVLSGSRGAVVALASAALVYFVLLRKSVAQRVLVMTLLAAVTFAFVTTTDVGVRASDMFQSRVIELTFGQGYSSARDVLFARALDLGLDHPVFGAGLNACTVYLQIYPHNLLLEAFSEGGAVGFSLLALMLTGVCVLLVRTRARLDETTIAAWALVFVSAQWSGDLYDSRGVFLLTVLLVGAGSEQAGNSRAARLV